MTTKLALQEVPSNNCKYLRIADNSWYNPNIPYSNGILEITVPGFSCPIVFDVNKMFNTAYNSSMLKIAPAYSFTDLIALPDGVYNIKYSVRPNDKLFVEYDLFRTCKATTRYMKAICDLLAGKCNLPSKEFEESKRKLLYIKELIDASKYMVEEAQDAPKGIALYNEADRLLNRLNDCGCV